MLENLYTTKMSPAKKQLENRFFKMLSKPDNRSRLIAVVLSLILVTAIIFATVVFAEPDCKVKGEHAITDEPIDDSIQVPQAYLYSSADGPVSQALTNSDGEIVYLVSFPLKEGEITNDYGERTHPFTGTSFHSGIDIKADEGACVYASTDGKVLKAEYDTSDGYYVLIESENGDIITKYAHLSKLEVSEKDTVDRGDVIGNVGMTGDATGPHLHFEVMKNGECVDPKEVLAD